MNWLALDIGGANLKLADGAGYAAACPFPLWRRPDALTMELRTLLAAAPLSDRLAVTMTGELADCFARKSDGVRTILEALEQAADGRNIRVFLSDGSLVAPPVAIAQSHLAAASNWRALAEFCGRLAPRGGAIVIDIGSTTTDITPLVGGQVASSARSDTQRLVRGELVYTGVERSPVCALVEKLPYRDTECPVAQELFATTLDVYLLLERFTENAEHCYTADSQPATRAAAKIRMARMLCADVVEFHTRDAVVAAQFIARRQAERIAAALVQVASQLAEPLATVVYSGHGEFLARQACAFANIGGPAVSLSEVLGPAVSRCAPAHALAVLARERLALR